MGLCRRFVEVFGRLEPSELGLGLSLTRPMLLVNPSK